MTTAPSSTTFSGQSLMLALSRALRPIQHPSPMNAFSAITLFSPIEHLVPTTSYESSALWPITTSPQITEFDTIAPGPITQLSPITELERETPSPIVQFLPMTTVPVTWSDSPGRRVPSPAYTCPCFVPGSVSFTSPLSVSK